MVSNQASGNISGTVVQAGYIERLTIQVDSGRYRVGNETPAAPSCFVNRDAVRRKIDERIELARAADKPALMFLYGPGGVGKTGAAAYWVEQHTAEFPDGVVYVKLADPERQVLESAGEALGAALRKLGVSEADLLATTEDRAAQLRALCRDKKVLLLLDDAANAAQLAYFRPTGRGCVLLGAGRWRPSGLSPDFFGIEVPRLDIEFAHRLVGELLAEHGRSVTAEESAVIVQAAKGFPIAIELIVSRLIGASDRQRARLLRGIADRGWDALAKNDKLLLTAHLDMAYDQLDADAAAAYRVLAAHPGRSFETELAEHMVGGDPEDVADALELLCDAHLLTVDDNGRFHFHDLAHAHARSKAGPIPSELAWRIVDWYLRYTVTFDRVLSDRPRSGPLYQVESNVEVTRTAALAWLERERVNLAGAVKLAEAAGQADLAWQLCEALWGLYHLHGHYEDWIDTHQVGLVAARRCGNVEAEMRMESQLGSAHLGLGELDKALECFRNSHGLAVAIGHRQGQESSLEWQGKIELRRVLAQEDVELRRGHAREALRCFDLAWAVADDPREFALLRLQRCRALLVLVEFAAARDEIVPAGEYFEPTAETDNKAKCGLESGRALAGLGEIDAARTAFATAERLFAEDGSESQRRIAEGLRLQLDNVQE
ncbi:AAA family ATPase [Kutzneria chonburiensis]|uniref:AAA family ATPase n=1 Tax=Kutzneria chonburiensis TaxID=1483604 RepID=A0ABV6N5V4_9PSEU|nr:AAA family ATPase [Kutzneria chonburiensis]